jgi:beta-N-acetylhexosaminidase
LSNKLINIIRKNIGFQNLIITDDISMKSLNKNIKFNTRKAFIAGCNLVLHCNAKMREMKIVAKNSPFISEFIKKKTKEFENTIR